MGLIVPLISIMIKKLIVIAILVFLIIVAVKP